MKKVSIPVLKALKDRQEKFAALALYDAPMAAMAERCDIPVVLVGDSLGMTMLGFDSTVPVTMQHMIYHVEAVRRGNHRSLIIGDLPFMSYATTDVAMQNATAIMQAGAHMVKLEGGSWLCDTVERLSHCGIPVCAHLGLTPQSINKLGGYRVQGRDDAAAKKMVTDAMALEQAGAELLVVECVPMALAKTITEKLSIPVIGIGAGRQCDGQILVINDIIGLTEKPPKFAKNFLCDANDIPAALKQFASDVRTGVFPAEENTFT